MRLLATSILAVVLTGVYALPSDTIQDSTLSSTRTALSSIPTGEHSVLKEDKPLGPADHDPITYRIGPIPGTMLHVHTRREDLLTKTIQAAPTASTAADAVTTSNGDELEDAIKSSATVISSSTLIDDFAGRRSIPMNVIPWSSATQTSHLPTTKQRRYDIPRRGPGDPTCGCGFYRGKRLRPCGSGMGGLDPTPTLAR